MNKETKSDPIKVLVTILFLVFAAPIGFFMMIFWTKWNIWVKILISIFWVPLASIGFTSIMLALIKT